MSQRKPLVLGFSAGSEGGNSEIALKEALMSAEATADVAVEHLRMHDFDIPVAFDGPENSVFPDVYEVHGDAAFLLDRLLEADALIITAPLYSQTPPGQLKVIADRILGPNASASFQAFMKERAAAGDPMFKDAVVDERFLKPKVGGFIQVGGAVTHEWFGPTALTMMHKVTFPMRIRIVDQFQIEGAPMPGSILLNDEAMKKCAALGRNVTGQIGKSFEDAEYKGDKPGACPSCHLDLVVLKGGTEVECATCGLIGELQVVNGEPVVAFPQDASKYDEQTTFGVEGSMKHLREMMSTMNSTHPHLDEIQKRVAKYESYDRVRKPPKNFEPALKTKSDLGLAPA